jgi:hypothetical protein
MVLTLGASIMKAEIIYCGLGILPALFLQLLVSPAPQKDVFAPIRMLP